MDIKSIPEVKRLLLEQLVEQLSAIPGMAAIALGGSYASGTQHEASDLDIGLYYWPDRPFDIAAIRQVAERTSTERPAAVTGFYGWGRWVNGGAWIHAAPGKVDFIYRNLEQLRQTISEAQQGIVEHDYDQQPAYGFYSVIYLAETQICIPLYDPDGLLSGLKAQVAVYPPRLRAKVVADALWSVEFTLLHARGFAARGDVYNTAGCLTRAATNLTQALFALNETYFLRDKQVMEVVGAFPVLPGGYVEQLQRLLACPGRTAAELSRALQDMEQLWRSVTSLPGVSYRPQFQV